MYRKQWVDRSVCHVSRQDTGAGIMDRRAAFFRWQHGALGALLGWGIGSVVAGAGLATQRNPVLRHFGLQALAWGGIDALLALAGRRGARSSARYDSTQAKRSAEEEAARFQTIVAVNAGLDVLYILGGWRLTRDHRRDRQGMGWGIIVQGAFLLIFDTILAWQAGRWSAGAREPGSEEG
jgi:hypothetical protein